MNKIAYIPKKYIWIVIRWTIGLLILYLVFYNIDLNQSKQIINNAKPLLLIIGLAHAPILILVAAIRWRFLIKRYFNTVLPLNFVIDHYWKGLALGFFTPASIGLDAYRIVISGKRFGDYTSSTVIIIVEKIIALITCMSIIVVLYPVIPINLTPDFQNIFYIIYILLFLFLLFSIGIFTALRNKMFIAIFKRIEKFIATLILKFSKKINLEEKRLPKQISLKKFTKPLASPKISFIIFLSFGIQFVSSVKSQIFFRALDYNIPFVVNLFAAPLIYFIFLLPVSFGSLGIREGVYIILYGLFGVPIEIALFVSFLNLSGMLLNNIIGGALLILARKNGTIPT